MIGLSLGWPWTGAGRVEGTFVVALLGQSNMIGRADFDGGTLHPAGVLQLGRAAPNDGALIAAAAPLDHHDPDAGDMGPDISFAQAWVATHPGADLVLVPSADGGTALGTGFWKKGGTGFADAVARINGVMAANPDFIFAGFLWHQGEGDEGNTAYQSDLDQMIADFRADVTVASATTPFVLGQLAQTWVEGGAGRQAVQQTISDTPNRVAHTAVVSSAGLNVLPDGLHFDAPGLRSLGARYAGALAQAEAGTGQPLTGPAAPQAFGTIPDQTDTVEDSGLAPPVATGTVPDQTDEIAALAVPQAQGTIPDQQDEVSP